MPLKRHIAVNKVWQAQVNPLKVLISYNSKRTSVRELVFVIAFYYKGRNPHLWHMTHYIWPCFSLHFLLYSTRGLMCHHRTDADFLPSVADVRSLSGLLVARLIWKWISWALLPVGRWLQWRCVQWPSGSWQGRRSGTGWTRTSWWRHLVEAIVTVRLPDTHRDGIVK